jgi:hypothetical protein
MEAIKEITPKIPKMETIRLTNPNYIGKLAPYIQQYIKRLNLVGVTYRSFLYMGQRFKGN